MHGRIKVKTTHEQQEEKRNERNKKLKLFKAALAIAFQKISANEYDVEGMNITKQILVVNSDYMTMWNYRKRALMHFKETRSLEDKSFWKNELLFIESCLRNNPKSYGCWHQRCFVMLEMDEANWENELLVTDLFLQLDDRNFHCWDYRRFLVKNSSHSTAKEIEFTNTLIENNFSNYSSWHYRSRLLPTVYPAISNFGRIAQEKLIEELELVQNAFFTDPNDQSAWFYHRWLLGRGELKQCILSLVVKKSPLSLTCTLRKPVQLHFFSNSNVTANDEVQEGKWISLSSDKYSHSWTFLCKDNPKYSSVDVECEVNGHTAQCSVSPMDDEGAFVSEVSMQMFEEVASNEMVKHMEDELKSCQELNKLEAGNKWVLLTLVLLMKSIDPVKYKAEIFSHLSLLSEVDIKRSQYYSDLRSRYLVEHTLSSANLAQRKVHINNLSLTRMCHKQFLACVVYLDISENKFSELSESFSAFISLQILKANDNAIKNIFGLHHLPALKEVDLRRNDISDQDDLLVLKTCPSFEYLHLIGNPLKSVLIDEDTKHLRFGIDIPFRN